MGGHTVEFWYGIAVPANTLVRIFPEMRESIPNDKPDEEYDYILRYVYDKFDVKNFHHVDNDYFTNERQTSTYIFGKYFDVSNWEGDEGETIFEPVPSVTEETKKEFEDFIDKWPRLKSFIDEENSKPRLYVIHYDS